MLLRKHTADPPFSEGPVFTGCVVPKLTFFFNFLPPQIARRLQLKTEAEPHAGGSASGAKAILKILIAEDIFNSRKWPKGPLSANAERVPRCQITPPVSSKSINVCVES